MNKEQRKELIRSIAERHRREDQFLKEVATSQQNASRENQSLDPDTLHIYLDRGQRFTEMSNI